MDLDFLRKLACAMLVCIMLNLSFVPVLAQDLPKDAGSEGRQSNESSLNDFSQGFSIGLADELGDGMPVASTETKTGEFVCSTPESDPLLNNLSAEEVAALRRATEIENKGYSNDNINSGRGQNPDRDVLANDIIVQTADDGSAVANQLPSAKMDTGEFSQLFNQYIKGAFAFGISLDDTIRIGQCNNPDSMGESNRDCPVEDRAQSVRTGGAGVVADVKLAWSDLKDWIGIDAATGNTGQYTKGQLEGLQEKAALEDENSLQTKSIKRETKLLGNSVKTEDFTASMATSGSSSAGLISIYSAFDKYFNSWFSTEMVVSNFGPTLFGQAKKYAGWLKRRGWVWDTSDSKFMQWFRRTFYDPEGLAGEARLKQIANRNTKYGFGDFMTRGIEGTGEWDSGYVFVKGGGWRKAMNEWGKPGGMFDQMTDPVVRGEFFKQVRDLRQVAHSNKAIYTYYDDAYKAAIQKFGAASPEAKAALIDSARSNARIMLSMDGEWLKLDALELWLKEDVTGLYSKGLKVKGTGNFVPITGDSKPMNRVQNAFADTGLFDGTDFATTPEGFLEIYKVSDMGEFIGEAHIDDIQKNFAKYVDKAIMTEKGDMVKLDQTSLSYIVQETGGTGKVKVYKADWVLDHVETPEMYASRLKNTRSDRIAGTFSSNMDKIYGALIERNFAGQSRRYYSILDKAFAQEQEILKSYFSIKGGAKWTLMPFLYWGGKHGFGVEAMSAYQLPEKWKEVKLSTGEEEIFNDAFIDVFAQEGSDEGDIFVQVLNKLPWQMVYSKVAEQFEPVDNAYKSITNPLSGWRREVENVGYFTSTSQECASCSAILRPMAGSQQALLDLQQKGRGKAEISFNAQDEMKSYFVEDVLTDEAKEEGTTLIAFAHHANVDGTRIGDDPESKPIDLVEAKKDETRCQDAIKEIGLGFLGDNPQRAAAILSFGESMGYVLFLWSGIIGSVIQQTLLVPKLQDCVDDVGGYYVHMFSPYDKKKETVESANEGASQKAGNVVQFFNEAVLGKAPAKEEKPGDDDKPVVDEQGRSYTPAQKSQSQKDETVVAAGLGGQQEGQKSVFEQAKDRIVAEAEKLGEKSKSKEILQMEIETKGKTDGTVSFEKSFFIWFKGYTQQAAWDNKSKYVLRDNQAKVDTIIDKGTGSIIVQKDGKQPEEVIKGKDQATMASHDGRVPAEVIPQRIGRVSLPSGPGIELFAMHSNGSFEVIAPKVLDCIRANIVQQTGVPLITNDITEAFGNIESIVTDSYSSIVPSKEGKSITANGAPRETIYGEKARVLVMSDMNTTMLDGREIPAGNFSSAQFKNGVIVYKPATAGRQAELIIWLRYHQRSILRNSDVSGLKATLANPIINPETGCPETAINLEAIANLAAGDESQVTERVENFNKSIEKMGPFQTFDTEKHRFIFYSQKTSSECNAADPGCCQQRVTIIDKETGDVYDKAIVGNVQQTPTGIKFTTEDGKQHTLDFSAENGIPKISYNGLAPETLLSAKGPNGAFWYDPENQQWYPYNAQLLPLANEFSKGFDTRHREDSSSSTLPGGNVMNLQLGGTAETPFNLPSLPAEPIAMLLFIGSLMAAICVSRHLIEKKIRS